MSVPGPVAFSPHQSVPSGAGFAPEPTVRTVRWRAATVLGIVPALAGWAALVATVVAISEIAASDTFQQGVTSSSWTPLRGVAAFVVGVDAYGGGFAPLPILCGLGALAVYALLFGTLGVALILAVQGPSPGRLGGLVQGVFYGGLVQAFIVNALVTGLIQSRPTVYESMPSWGWWVGNLAFGGALGLATAAFGAGGRWRAA